MNPDQSPPTASATLTVRPSVPEDAAYLAPRLSKADLDSVLASGSPSAEVSLNRGIAHSVLCLTAVTQDETPVLMFGTVPYPEDATVGSLWLLGSDEMRNHEESLLKEIQRYLGVIHRTYPILSAFVDCRNSLALERLGRCGFEFAVNTVPGPGPGAHPFREAYSIRNDQCVIH